MERIKVLIGKKISLVVPEREDAKIWYKGINDLENQTLLAQRGTVLHLETEYDYYESLRKDATKKLFCIMINKSEKIIGNISLMNISEKNRNAIMGIALFDKNEQNKGFGTESVELILKYGFEVLGLHKIRLEVLDINKKALRVYEKCGFVETGRFKDEIFMGKKYNDTIQMEIMKKDYFI